jgi:hypothetical protein
LLRKRPNFRKKTAEKTPKSLGKSWGLSFLCGDDRLIFPFIPS